MTDYDDEEIRALARIYTGDEPCVASLADLQEQGLVSAEQVGHGTLRFHPSDEAPRVLAEHCLVLMDERASTRRPHVPRGRGVRCVGSKSTKHMTVTWREGEATIDGEHDVSFEDGAYADAEILAYLLALVKWRQS